MSDYPMLISNKLHSFRNFFIQRYTKYPWQVLRFMVAPVKNVLLKLKF